MAFNKGYHVKHSLLKQLMTGQEYNNHQVDIALLDFSKAFDNVPHQRLLTKVEYYIYGITGKSLMDQSFLGTQLTVHFGI